MFRNPKLLLAAALLGGGQLSAGLLGWLAGVGEVPSTANASSADAEGAAPYATAHCQACENLFAATSQAQAGGAVEAPAAAPVEVVTLEAGTGGN